MNPATNPIDSAAPSDAAAVRQCVRILVPVTLATALTDFVFWDGRLGLSVGVFFAGLGALIMAHHAGRPRRSTIFLALLLLATCVQCAIDLSLSGAVVAAALTIAIAGRVFQPQLAGAWASFSEAAHGLLTAPKRWIPVSAFASQGVGALRSPDRQWSAPAIFALRAMLPAVVLLVVFAAIFSTGNAVFGNLMQRVNEAVFAFWDNLNVTPLRILWWIMVATLALGIFHRMRAPAEPRWWTRIVPRIPRRDSRLARWQAITALLAMNALFCMVNTLDAIFVWGDATLPPGVNHSAFVHAGVNSLILAVMLSAVVIAGIFQQDEHTTASTWLKRLAYLWVLQNLLLIGGVLRRLMIYTEAYQLTEKRVYVACFLALVTAGFLLLARFVQKRHSFNWLVGTNALAVFGLFYVLQFADVGGAVARYNVARWHEGKGIDIDLLTVLGPGAWPELARVARDSRDPAERARAKMFLTPILETPLPEDWRAFQWLEQKNRHFAAAYLAQP